MWSRIRLMHRDVSCAIGVVFMALGYFFTEYVCRRFGLHQSPQAHHYVVMFFLAQMVAQVAAWHLYQRLVDVGKSWYWNGVWMVHGSIAVLNGLVLVYSAERYAGLL